MASLISHRTAKSIVFLALFALAVGDVLDKAKETSSHAFEFITDFVSIGEDSIQHIVRLATQKQADAERKSSFTAKLFGILFPSSKPAINALLATAYISGPPNFLLALCPPNIDPGSLSIMVAFAVGGLLGDTFFHLLPEIFLGEDDVSKVKLVHIEPNRNTLLGVFILIGLATFMAMDKALRIATGGAHSHSHGGQNDIKEQAKKIDETDYRLIAEDLPKLAKQETPEDQRKRLADKPYNDNRMGDQKIKDVISELAATNQQVRQRHKSGQNANTKKEVSIYADEEDNEDENETEHELTKSTSLTQSKPIKSLHSGNHGKELNPSVKLAGLLNLIADFTHNITDGLALSTSFYSSPALGATTTMAVFFHEIPHEVGDFALLIQSGFSKRNAMAAQFLTAVGAFLGTIIGILVQEYGSGDSTIGGKKEGLLGTSLQWSDMLLPFTAGTFLYVGTVGVIPELLENEKGNTRMQELTRTFLQFVAMAFGALIMVAISWG